MSIMKKYISNWDELTEEQKETAKKQLKGNPGLNAAVVHPAAKFFEEHRWVKIDKFIDRNMANLLYHHTQLEAARLGYFEDNDIKCDEDIWGTFSDSQAPGDFSKYGDPIMDTLLSLSLTQMETLTGMDLVPTYSYHRLYTQGTELKRHSDRPSCEISTTLCLGYDNSNIDASTYPDWSWPMFVKEKDGKEIAVDMKPGDMIIYRGCELEHWREPLKATNHAQVFLHYNEKGGEYDIPYDSRPLLGLPSGFRDTKVIDDKEEILGEKTNNESWKKVIY
jgi:hypothetical protein